MLYTSPLSDWKVLLFNDIRHAISFKQLKDAYYLCVSNVERLYQLGWSLPPDINPDMTRIVDSLDAAVEYAFVSQPFVSLKDTNAIKIFVEHYQRDEEGGCICHPLTLSDREYLFHPSFTPTLHKLPVVLEQLMVMVRYVLLDSTISTLIEDDSSYYVIDSRHIAQGLEHRTTVMLRNIPNKYTQVQAISLTLCTT